jgi:hypothetical protein
MAASYQSGTSSSPTNLLQTLVTWLVAQGWTQDASASDGTGWRAHLHKSGLYVNLRAAENEKIWVIEEPPGGWLDATDGYGIGLYLGDGYSGAAAWHKQSGRPMLTEGTTIGSGMNLPSGSVAGYHFFDDGQDNIIVVVERSPGLFCHLGWGPSMVKTGFTDDFPFFFASSSAKRAAWEGGLTQTLSGINATARAPLCHADVDSAAYGGNYGDMVHSTAFVRVDAGTFTGRWVGNGNQNVNGGIGYGYTGRYMRCALNLSGQACSDGELPGYQYLADRVHQVAFAGALILPIHCFVLTDPGARWAPLGYAQHVFWCTGVDHGYAAGEIYQVGGLDYMLFPGFAVRKAA